MAQRIKKQFFKILPVSVVVFMIFALAIGIWQGLPVNDVEAVNDYSVTGGDLVSLPVVGAASAAINTITITESTADDFLADPETLTIAIDNINYPAVVFDQTITTLTIAGTCGYTGHNAVSYTDAYTITIPVTGGTSCADAETITIAGLKVSTIHAQTAPGAFGLINVDNTTTSSGSPVTTTTTINLSVTAADAIASLTLANGTVGATQNTTLGLTVPVNLANGDTISFDAPANLDVASAAFSSTSFGGTGFTGCVAVGQTVTCTVNSDLTAGTGNIVMTGIFGKYADTGQTITNVMVYDTSALANIATDASGLVTDTTVADANASLTLGTNSVVGETGDSTLTLTIPVDMANSDAIDFDVSANLDVSGVAYSSDTFGGAGSFSCSIGGPNQVICIANGVISKGTGTIVMSGIEALYAATGQNITEIYVYIPAANMAYDASGTVDDTTVGDLTGTNVEPATLIDSAIGLSTITFTTSAPIPANGKIKVTYGAGYDVSGATGGSCSSMDGTFATSVSGQTVTITRQNDGSAEPAGAQTCTVGGIVNQTTGSTGTYAILTTTSVDASIEQDTAVAADTIVDFIATATTDDNDVDGQIDRIILALNADVTGASVAGTDFSVTVPGYSVSSASRTNASEITIVLTESGSPDTAATPTVTVISDIGLVAGGSVSSGSKVSVDGAVPVLLSFTSTTGDGTYGPGQGINITATYSENISGGSITVSLNNTVTGQTLSTISTNTISGTYTVGATGNGEEVIGLDVSAITAHSATDGLNANSSLTMPSVNITTSSSIGIDTVAPYLVGINLTEPNGDWLINEADADGINTATVTLIFSEPMDTFTLPIGSSTPGDIGSSSGFNWDFTPVWSFGNTQLELSWILSDGNEEFTASALQVSVMYDVAGNLLVPYDGIWPLPGPGQTLTVDTIAPTGTVSVDTDPITLTNNTQTVTVTYSEAMDPGSTSTITFTGSVNFSTNSNGAWSGGNTIWTESFDHDGTSETVVGVSVASSLATDVAGNVEGASVPDTFDIDTATPTMTAVTADTDANGTVDQITITFSEAVDINDTGGIADGLDSITLGDGCTIPIDVDYTSSDVTSLVISDLTGCRENDTGITPSVTYTTQLGCGNNFAICSNAPNEMADATTTTAVDNAAPVFLGALYLDMEPDGTVDGFMVYVSENVSYTYNAGDWTLVANGLTGMAVTGCAACTNTNQLTFYAPAISNLTGVSGGTEPTIAYTAGNPITEDAAAGHTVAGFGPVSMFDVANPVIIKAEYKSSGNNGTVDTIDVYFTEAVTWNYGSLTQFGIINNDLIGLDTNASPNSASGSGTAIITLTTSGTTNLTGVSGGTEPTLSFANALLPYLGNHVLDLGYFTRNLKNTTAFAMLDAAAPTVASISPVDNATSIAVTADLVLSFYENVQAGTGNVVIKKTSDNSTVETIAITDGGKVTFDGTTGVTINPASNLDYSTEYYIQIDNTAIEDASNNAYAGIADTTTWNFTTAAVVLGGGGGYNPPVDTTPPTNTSISINSGAVETASQSVTLTLGATDAAQMMIANSADFSGAIWETYAASKTWLLTGGVGEKTVYAKFKDAAGNISASVSDTINSTATTEIPADNVGLILQDPAPAPALPVGVNIGTLVKRADMSSVYFIDQDNRRHAFPNEAVYFSYYPDFSGIQIISSSVLAAIPLGSNVTMRPGTYLVKIQSDPKVYAVSPYGVLKGIGSEAIAASLYGADWATRVIDVEPTFFTNYQIGPSITTAIHPAGSAFSYAGDTKVYYVEGGNKRYVSTDVFIINKFQNKFVIRNLATSITYPAGADLPAQGMDQIMTLR